MSYGEPPSSALEADRDMPERRERLQIAPRPAAEIEDRERRLRAYVIEQRGDVLADVVTARAFPECAGALFVVGKREAGNPLELFRLHHSPICSSVPRSRAFLIAHANTAAPNAR